MATTRMRRSSTGRRTPAHALPPEPSKFAVMVSRANPLRRDARARKLARARQAHRPPDVADMLTRVSAWEQGAHVVRTPAFCAATVAYLACAWIAIGPAVSPPASDDPQAASNVAGSPLIPPTATRRLAPRSAPISEPQTAAPSGVQIDPQFFAGLQSVLDDIDERLGSNQATYPQQDVVESATSDNELPTSTSGAGPLHGPAIVPTLGLVPDPNGQAAAAIPSDASVLPPIVVPDGQVAAPVPPSASLTPPPGLATPSREAVPPSAPPSGVDGQQPLGPPPGPVA